MNVKVDLFVLEQYQCSRAHTTERLTVYNVAIILSVDRVLSLAVFALRVCFKMFVVCVFLSETILIRLTQTQQVLKYICRTRRNAALFSVLRTSPSQSGDTVRSTPSSGGVRVTFLTDVVFFILFCTSFLGDPSISGMYVGL